MKKSKVFVGPANTSNVATSVAVALRTVGIYAHSYSYTRNTMNYQADYNNILWSSFGLSIWQKLFINRVTTRFINPIIRFCLFCYAIIKYDTFIFISPHTFFRKNIDLPIINLFNKKIAVILIGCGDRDPNDKINSSIDGACSLCTDFKKQRQCFCNSINKKKSRIEKLAVHSNYIFAVEDLVGFIKNKKYYEAYVTSNPPHQEINIYNKFNTSKVVISHFPSNQILKGTKYVTQAIEKIIKIHWGKIEYISERKLNNEVLEILENKSNILIDQFCYGYHGGLAVEAMARGNVVIARIAGWFKKNRPELPIISCDVNNIEDTLKELISDSERMKKIAKSSIEYYKKYHSPVSVGNYYKNVMDLK